MSNENHKQLVLTREESFLDGRQDIFDLLANKKMKETVEIITAN